MEKDRTVKVIAILALVVAVAGLSVGFAAFTSVLTIEPTAIVIPEDNMHVIFSDNASGVPSSTTIAGVPNAAMTAAATALSEAGVTAPNLPAAANATIDNSNLKAPKVTGLVVTFTAPGQSAYYDLYAVNQMSYDAFLRSITFDTSKFTCTPDTGTDATTAQAVCQSIRVDATYDNAGTGAAAAYVVGNGTGTNAKSEYTAATANTLGSTGKPIRVTISYPDGSPETNGKVTVRMPDVLFTFSSTSSD